MAGFIMKQVAWMGGQSGSTAADVRDRAKQILTRVANLLIESTMWELDTDHNSTTTSYMSNSATEASQTAFVLFLKSKLVEAGSTPEKLMLGYSIGNNIVNAPFGFRCNSNSMMCLEGLFTSMIPAGSSSTFGNTWLAEGFIPADATLVMSSTSSNNYNNYNMAYRNAAATTYHAQIVTDGHIISFRMYAGSSWGHWWFVGPIIKTLAHPTVDILPTSKMLSMSYMQNGYEGSANDISGYGSGLFYDYVDSSRIEKYNQIEFFNAEGNHIQSDSGRGIFFSSSTELNSSRISNSSITGFNRWTAIYIGVHSGDPTAHYVVKGDGMKGYLDTNFLRHVRTDYTFGQTFDDGNFIYIGHGLAMGWDPTNGPLNAA